MILEELKEKAAGLPLVPGVYLMRDKTNQVIYVGKAKKLKNRVSQYFQDTASHTPKTRLMVSKVDHFDVIVAASEFEALVLECSLIKRHQPKYNILLKDDKGYPYLRLNMKDIYPEITLVNRPADDGASYFGPFGSRGTTNAVMQTIRSVLKLPSCGKKFPRDVGKERPCLNYHMGQCAGWCQSTRTAEEYRQIIEQAKQLLSGNYKSVADQIRTQMLSAAEALNFELAATLRDRLNAVEALSQKQLVTALTLADTDVIGYAQTESNACFTVLHFSGGNLLDKDFEIIALPDDPETAVSSLMKQYYLNRGFAPKMVLLPFKIDDSELFEELLLQQFGRKPKLRIPQRGENLCLVALAEKNALEEAQRAATKEERTHGTLVLLGKMLGIDPPERIEAYDISNISGTDIVAGMIVFENGKPHKSAYKRFMIQDLQNQDDYASMQQVITRRFTHLKNEDRGFDSAPDLVLIDGGVAHAATALETILQLGLHLPVFGMVKDDKHRTRALVTPEGKQIAIDGQQSVFSFIGTIQEEVHRFAITYHRKLRSKRLRYSELDTIPGVGPKRKEDLLKAFKSITAIRSAAMDDLTRVLPRDVAYAVYQHFHTASGGEKRE
ncbi:MAG: excinuclease ABC subunit UvrC [Oscillospiraceae bacterium]|nr:excinuclease ABC subunit UvrC [Oscillospiraceae bacterium]